MPNSSILRIFSQLSSCLTWAIISSIGSLGCLFTILHLVAWWAGPCICYFWIWWTHLITSHTRISNPKLVLLIIGRWINAANLMTCLRWFLASWCQRNSVGPNRAIVWRLMMIAIFRKLLKRTEICWTCLKKLISTARDITRSSTHSVRGRPHLTGYATPTSCCCTTGVEPCIWWCCSALTLLILNACLLLLNVLGRNRSHDIIISDNLIDCVSERVRV